MTNDIKTPEPWLRGTLSDTPAVLRAVLHALQSAEEELVLRCGSLTDEEINERPAGLPSVAFHLRHIARSVDRLITYAEGRDLSDEQLQALKSESVSEAGKDAVFHELAAALREGAERVRRVNPEEFDTPRSVGRRLLPTSLGGLLVHVADHTQRHVGQAITTTKLLIDKRAAARH